MLNRRFLRVKALQALYAYEQAKYADFQLAKDYIYQAYEPDWDEKKDADWNLIQQQRQESTQIFVKNPDNPSAIAESTADYKVKKIALEAINQYRNQIAKDQSFYTRTMLGQADKMYDIYLSILLLLVELSDLAKADREQLKNSYVRKDQVTGNFKFAESPICAALRQHELFGNEVARRGVDWKKEEDQIRELYRNSLKTDEIYQKYDQSPATDFEGEQALVLHILKNVIFNQKTVNYFSVSEVFLETASFLSLAKMNSYTEVMQIMIAGLNESLDLFVQAYGLSNELKTQLLYTTKDKITAAGDEIRRLPFVVLNEQENKQNFKKKDFSPANTEKQLEEEHRLRIAHLIERVLGILIQQGSDFLVHHKLNQAGEQNRNVEMLYDMLAKYLEKIGVQWYKENKITIQVKVEQISFGINDYFAENDLNWAEDHKIILSMVQKTIKSINADQSAEFELISLSKNWEDDKQFFQDLMKKTIENDQEYEGYISAKAQNWDMTRLALLDRAILKMAICEMITFYSIPVKVTINEYIELAKMYSTPKSKQFVNGLLDAISQDLIAKKIIRKSGRGLLDN
ncbi:MAG: transcription antitermination factor NusB [Microscillaceae bacterium]|jgi:transcription antitermination factor NusB|nr:transcription antitermination factor NusB [Microscillaceae bacterium]